MTTPLSANERAELRHGNGDRWALGFVLVALAMALALPRFSERRITRLRDDINEVATPARERVAEIQLQTAISAAQVRSQLLSGRRSLGEVLSATLARRRDAERELSAFAAQLDPSNEFLIPRTAERLARVHAQVDSMISADVLGPPTVEMIAQQRVRFLAAEALGDTLIVRIDSAAALRRAEIARTEQIVARLTGLALLLGLGAAVVVARLAAGFRSLALRLDESDQRAREIAEQERAARAAVERHQGELESVTESRARLLRGFTHDVKNPLGSADGYLALIQERVYGEVPGQVGEAVARARRSIAQALDLIRSLLDIARAEAGQLDIRRAHVDLREVVLEVVDAFCAQAQAKRIALSADLPAEPLAAHTDHTRVRQVLGNLLSNAVKYTPTGGTVTVCATTFADKDLSGRRRVVISVTDDGPGIPPDKLPLLFKEFTRFDPEAAEGAGVGLAISQKIAEALGGSIAFESPEMGGARFTFSVPLGDRRMADVTV